MDEVGVRTLQQARRALAKHEFSVVKKSKPLYGWILKAVWERGLVKGLRGRIIFALWVLAYAIMARFGEVVGKSAAVRKQVMFMAEYKTYVFHHFKAPKANKLREAEYATISEEASPFCFWVLRNHLARMRELKALGKPDSFLFPAVKASGEAAVGESVSKSDAVVMLQEWLQQLGVPEPERYTGHCARRGRYNDMKNRVPAAVISAQAHWAPGSSTGERDYSVSSFAERRRCF
jgi:hypothetical protein